MNQSSRIGKKQMLSSIPVNLIRQWCYCPRVVYYQEMLNIAVERPRWVEQGEDFHQQEQKLWKRRNLTRFSLQAGERYYQLSMKDTTIKLHGIVDMAIETDDAAYPVEFKMSSKCKNRGAVLQLVAYGILLEKHLKKPVTHGFLIGNGKILHVIEITKDKKEEVLKIAEKIANMLAVSLKPDSNASAVQCCNCEYVNYCNDRF